MNKGNETMKKITVVGAGNVGTTTAQLIAERALADVVLIDVLEGVPQGKALDIFEACPLWHSGSKVTGTNDYADTAGSAIAVITAGLARKPGMSRDDLLHANAAIMKTVARNIAAASPDCIIIVVTNPMDAMAQVAMNVTGFPHGRVIGMGGVLDTARMRSFISISTGAHPADIHAMVLGGHGDLMVPMISLTTVHGKNVSEIIKGAEMEQIIERTKNGGAEIVGLLKSGSAYYAPAASTVEMIENIFGSKSDTLPCSVYLSGQYGIEGVYTGVPVTLGPEGLKEIIEIDLTSSELMALRSSAEAVRELVGKVDV
jgi:malate dehydrogenase